jgi:hypothetical protein
MTNPFPMKANKFLLIALFAFPVFAQHITTGKLKSVRSDGYHRILLPPEIRSFSKEDLSNLRIYDSRQNEVPYFVLHETQKAVPHAENYPIVDKSSIAKKNTSYIIETSGKKLNGMTLIIGNSDRIKTYDLSGSDDKTQWFGISNKAVLGDLSSDNATTVEKNISFPLSAYRYMKITFNDSLTLPINVIGARNVTNEFHGKNLVNFSPKNTSISDKKSEKKTIIKVSFESPQIINRITFNISGPTFYKRNVAIYKNATRTFRRKTQHYQEFLCNFEVSSNQSNSIDIPQLFESEIFLQIENRDNPPLEISGITFSQYPVFVVAELKAGESYSVKTGDATVFPPQYDVPDLVDIEVLPSATITGIEQEKKAQKPIVQRSFWQTSWFLWVCIGIGAAAIVYFATSLVKDMKRD